jgi:hypothetical protein
MQALRLQVAPKYKFLGDLVGEKLLAPGAEVSQFSHQALARAEGEVAAEDIPKALALEIVIEAHALDAALDSRREIKDNHLNRPVGQPVGECLESIREVSPHKRQVRSHRGRLITEYRLIQLARCHAVLLCRVNDTPVSILQESSYAELDYNIIYDKLKEWWLLVVIVSDHKSTRIDLAEGLKPN